MTGIDCKESATLPLKNKFDRRGDKWNMGAL